LGSDILNRAQKGMRSDAALIDTKREKAYSYEKIKTMMTKSTCTAKELPRGKGPILEGSGQKKEPSTTCGVNARKNQNERAARNRESKKHQTDRADDQT